MNIVTSKFIAAIFILFPLLSKANSFTFNMTQSEELKVLKEASTLNIDVKLYNEHLYEGDYKQPHNIGEVNISTASPEIIGIEIPKNESQYVNFNRQANKLGMTLIGKQRNNMLDIYIPVDDLVYLDKDESNSWYITKSEQSILNKKIYCIGNVRADSFSMTINAAIFRI